MTLAPAVSSELNQNEKRQPCRKHLLVDRRVANLHNSQMPKSIKNLAFGILGVLLLIATVLLAYKGVRYLQNSHQVDKINSCLESGGCMDPNTMECGPYVANEPKLMCGAKKE